jgi:hypothetical protein
VARPQFHHGGASLAVLISGAGVLQHEGAEGGLAVMAAPISFALAYLRRPPSDEKQKGKEGGGSARGACRKEKGGKGERGCSGGERRGWVQFGMCYATGGARVVFDPTSTRWVAFNGLATAHVDVLSAPNTGG